MRDRGPRRITMLHAARALTARGIGTARGGAWSPVQVNDILRREHRMRRGP
jgi:hypothetical protein